MKKSALDTSKAAKNVAKALAEVPIDTKEERDALRARIRQKYQELMPLTESLNKTDRERFDELGELMDQLEECESRPPQARSEPA